ncbi:MAG: apolipoprotein N-acyltransferase [Gammaproteobacteria bacterium]|jgi:apolipoprotein N-acyltransferase|nr:apolipoprotein N-acyltransferase [Gammaproteobacteria bacterium]
MSEASAASVAVARPPSSALIMAAAAGACQVLAFAPFGYHWVAPLTLGFLLLLWSNASVRHAAWIGYSFGLGHFVAGTYWLYISLNILGGLWPPLAVLLMLALVAALAAYIAATGALVVWLAPHDGVWRWLVVFPGAWLVCEWLRGWLITGFPWLSLGYSQVSTPLGGLAPLLGVYGVSMAALLLAGLTVIIVRRAWPARLAAFAAVAAALLALQPLERARWTEPVTAPLNVTLVQGAIPQERKWRADQLQPTLDLYRRLSLEVDGQDLIVWPEAAIPAFPFEVSEFITELRAELRRRDTQLFTGILTYDSEQGQYLNTLWALGTESGEYHKRHLVMFGEYFPLPEFAKRWLRIMNLPSEDIASGAADQPLLTAKGVPVATTICYEIAFAAEQLPFITRAQLLVNVSNDAWFGDSIAPHQHLQISQMRAREAGRYLLRATNTGITAVIDPTGRVLERLPQFEAGVIRMPVLPHTGPTPYARLGNWPVLTLAFAALLSSGWRRWLQVRPPR